MTDKSNAGERACPRCGVRLMISGSRTATSEHDGRTHMDEILLRCPSCGIRGWVDAG